MRYEDWTTKTEFFQNTPSDKLLTKEETDVLLRTLRETEDTGLKFDKGKTPLELLPFEALEDVAKVLELGRDKYGAYNWAKGMDWTRLLGATLRHLFAWSRGIEKDEESNLSHLAHAACCILFLMTYQTNGLGKDDRYKQPKEKDNG